MGVLRTRAVLDTVITRTGGRTLRSIQKQLLAVLRVAVYEWTFCPESPEHALVHEAVESAKRMGGPRPAGFVNALLRRIQSHLVQRQVSLATVDPRRAVVQDPASGCLFDIDLWPDPVSEFSGYLSDCYNLPEWLVASWLAAYGPEPTRQICQACQRRPSITLRPNPCRRSRDDLLADLRDADIQARPVEPDLIHLTGSGAVTRLPGFNEGWFSVQDRTAAAVVPLLAPQPGERILDLCAAPGGKTTHLAEATKNRADILATDIDHDRLIQVRDNADRLGHSSVRLCPYDEVMGQKPSSFDAVLLDVPCSNTGVLAKRVEARYRLRAHGREDLLVTQAQLLDRAAPMVVPGGRLAYSTCSIQPEENREQVQRFLRRRPDFTCTVERVTLPQAGDLECDGGYVAVLLRC
jgi:16S rRNA (cytosine967-C5)-methyltransferase